MAVLQVTTELNDEVRFKHCYKILKKRYLKFKIEDDGTKKIIENPRQMFERVALNLSDSEREFVNFFNMMYNLDALPNSPTIWGAGMPKTLLNACAVLEIEDDMNDIMIQLQNGVELQALGSGVGFYFGNIRSKDILISTSGGKALGVIAVIDIYNNTFDKISQGGRRRGAFMGVLPVWHDEIFEFIMAKDDTSKFKMFNLSVSFTDEFFEVLDVDGEFQLYSPVKGQLKPTRKVKASKIWDMFKKQSHKNGEPSAIFIDTIQKRFPNVNTTNPCSEALLEHMEFCNLGSINLMNHLKINGNDEPDMDWQKLRKTVKTMVIMLNRVINKNYYPEGKDYQRVVNKHRKIGIGIMGFADILIYHHKIKYSSQKARDLARKIMRFIREQARRYSERYHFKNQALTSIAPTGSISMIAGVSSGIEPIIHKKYTRTTMEGYTIDIDKGIEGNWVETAHEISPINHLRMVAAVAKDVDMGASKTINFLHNVSQDDIGEMYKNAWKSGVTGIACYRDGSRGGQPIVKCDDDNCSL
jgi:ribonucleoside-diphosphate reductase alpha chain